jgi:UDP-glucose 4-epimerase
MPKAGKLKVVISGHRGFLGSALVKELQTHHDIIGISRTKSQSSYKIREYLSSELDEIDENPEIVIMCHAAVSSGNIQIDTQELYNSNVLFTSELIKHFPKAYFLFISSISVYGNQSSVLMEETAPSPVTEYAISKLWGEEMVRQIKRHGILRLSSLYGEDMKENTIIPNYVNQALSKGCVEVWGNGERKQNYIHVLDVVSFIKKIIENKIEGVFLGVSSKEYSNAEIAKILSAELNILIKFTHFDNSQSVTMDNQITRKVLGITSEMDFVAGLKEYINWKQKQS